MWEAQLPSLHCSWEMVCSTSPTTLTTSSTAVKAIFPGKALFRLKTFPGERVTEIQNSPVNLSLGNEDNNQEQGFELVPCDK
ncbi:hypothetical protein E2C01_043260 [Portunus trituberculatus]|uniref:Uncharacterized protein n=1 Tax=Portunus trituberculatus TaxID=210409 RepID=A0A5B7FX27_PORTR|nr:hypothetical protein [Portunus trituberculatus]